MTTKRKNFSMKKVPLLLHEWRVKERIDALGLTQVKVAEEMQMTVGNLNRYIKARRPTSRQVINKLAVILGVYPRYITRPLRKSSVPLAHSQESSEETQSLAAAAL